MLPPGTAISLLKTETATVANKVDVSFCFNELYWPHFCYSSIFIKQNKYFRDQLQPFES